MDHRGATSDGMATRPHCHLVGPSGDLEPPLLMPLAINSHFPGKKMTENYQDFHRHLHKAENFALWQDDSAGETSLREGEIDAIVITNTLFIIWIINNFSNILPRSHSSQQLFIARSHRLKSRTN